MSDKRTTRPDADETTEATIDNERMGRNSLQGNDQEQVRNQRQTQPDSKDEADTVIESFEKVDKDKRAREDLGKGARKS
jgi:hypothetical protein